MGRKLTGNPPGPVPKAIDWTLFEQLCAVQCTQSEIASMLKIHIDTLRDRTKEHYGDEYSNIYKKFAENGKCSLRRNQFILSKTNTAMAIWLGKQWLGQKEPEQDHDYYNRTPEIGFALSKGKELKNDNNRTESQASKEPSGMHGEN